MGKVGILLDMIKIEHTLFSMPFLYSGAVLAANGLPSAWILFWITLGLFSARTAAMTINRLVDREIDARNPRTKDRPSASGVVTPGEMKVMIAVSLLVLLVCAAALNRLTLALYPLAVALFVVYPYLKRFTWLAHVPLGMSLGIAPLGAWVAVTASFDIAPWLLFFAVTFWVAGFDIIYALQDLEFDLKEGLRSIPARFGVEGALRLSALFHGLTVLFLFAMVPFSALGVIFLAGSVIITALLVYEHSMVSPDNLERVGKAFFDVNVAVGVLIFLAISADVFL